MTNEEKAKEIAYKCFPDTFEHETFGCPNCEASKAESACLEMAKWKDNQMIEKAVRWLGEHMVNYGDIWMGGWNGESYDQDVVDNSLIRDFKQAMMEE